MRAIERPLPGERFGRWLVLSGPVAGNGGRTCSCQCDCGTRRDVLAIRLRKGKTVSCGCSWRHFTGAIPVDGDRYQLAGMRFGRWTVLAHSRGSHWLCRCDCGTEAPRHAHKLLKGQTSSCGCGTAASIHEAAVQRAPARIACALENYEPEPNTGCWLWLGRRDDEGYGRFKANGVRLAHREFYLHHRGAIPDGHDVLHRCDTPACVNPNHLFTGTHADNMRDMIKKGRASWQKRAS